MSAPRIGTAIATCALLVALTSLELIVVGLGMERAARITTLAGLLIAKVGLVIFFLMRARQDRRSARLTLTAIVFAAGVAVVLMLETVFRVNVT
jgi:heme/copper-type cytochrome/quinol oxidase subunit 4